MSRSGRKQKLYELGREALKRIVGREVPGYVCPLCLRGFEGWENLSEEHVPQRSIGGKVLCLTCSECNSGAGHRIDADVHREKQSRSFLAPDGSPRRVKIQVGMSETRIEMRRSAAGFALDVLGDQNDPRELEALKPKMQGIIEAGGSFRLRDTVSYSRRRADIGYLKSAYLAAFSRFGYRYILRQTLDRVRQQIQEPDRPVLDTVRVYAGEGLPAQDNAFLLFYRPFRCMGVKFGDAVTCLPLPDGSDLFYDRLSELRETGQRVEWRASGTVRWPEGFELALDFVQGDSSAELQE